MCEECLDLVPAKILIEGEDVYYQKRCRTHGVQKTKVSSDATYFKSTKEYIKPGDRPLKYQAKTEYGCPLDCGLCPDHEQHSCVALIEINEECNLTCPVCFAGSSPTKTTNLSLETIEAMLDTLVSSEGEPDVLQISGGEPTIHPQILEILALAKSKPIRHLMVNTNGLRIAQDKKFVEELVKFSPGFEIYLQFDSLEKEALQNLRGADLRRIRSQALQNLEEAGLSTSLVMTVKKGVNDHEIGKIIDYALKFKCVRGITFQPIQDVGRNEGFNKNNDRFLLSDVRRSIYEQSSKFEADDIIPLPCNPESIAIGYALRSGDKITPVTSMFPKEEMIKTLPNAVSFEKQPDLRQKVIDLFSMSSGDVNTAERMESLLCCLPKVPAIENLSYENIFRISVVQFLDRYNFCVGNVKRSCIHFVTREGQIIPFDTYNLLYRNGEVEKLREKIKS
ncbi:MAG: radical SAM protein [Emcibacteraceae bacterium]